MAGTRPRYWAPERVAEAWAEHQAGATIRAICEARGVWALPAAFVRLY